MFSINKEDLSCIVTKYGDRFIISQDLHCSTSVFWRYDLSDIRPDDRVIDLGANVGGFAIAAAHRVFSHPVLALEPVRFGILAENVLMNNALVTPMRAAISNRHERKTLTWRDGTCEVDCYPLGEIISHNGGCDFLKCDIEGAEWLIDPHDLDGIRRIEIQIHLDQYPKKWEYPPLLRYLYKNFNVYETPNTPTDRISVPPHPPRADHNRPQLHCFRVEEDDPGGLINEIRVPYMGGTSFDRR